MPKSVGERLHDEFEAVASQARVHAEQALQAVDSVLGLDCNANDEAPVQPADIEENLSVGLQ